MNEVTFMILRYVPEAVIWILGIRWAVRMRRENYDAAGKLFYSGCVLMLVRIVFRVAAFIIFPLSDPENTQSAIDLARQISFANVPGAAVAIVGIICLFMAFQKRFFTGEEA